jgi:iron complex outermembrane receptor protein
MVRRLAQRVVQRVLRFGCILAPAVGPWCGQVIVRRVACAMMQRRNFSSIPGGSMPQMSVRHPSVPHALAVAAGLALALPAMAQQAPAPQPGQLQVITVTAEKRVENIRDVPSSISAIQGESLEILNSGGQDVRQLAGRVPSLNIESSFGRAFPRFYIRGIGNTDFDINASQPVSLVLDEVVQENPILKGFPMFDLEGIEVLRGPQGTQYGRNSPAGVVKFNSARPTNKLEGYGIAAVGRDSMFNLEGAVNVPLSPVVAMRFSLQSQRRDDWVKNTVATAPTKDLEGYTDNAARVQLRLAPNKDFDALLNLHARRLDGSARVFRANIIQPGTNNLVAGFDPRKVSQDGINSQEVDTTGGSLRLRWALGGGLVLSSITGYESVKSLSRGDIDGGFGASFLPASGPGFIPFDAESADGLPKHKQLSQELRLEGSAGAGVQWMVGAYYFDESLNIDSFNFTSIGSGPPANIPPNGRNGYATQQQDNKAWAVFGNVNVDLTKDLKLRAGVRYTDDQKDFVADRITAPPFSPTFIGRRTASTSATNTSGDLALSWALSKDVNLYGRIASGFRAPSIQGRLLFGDQLSVAKSERILSYELGVKADLMNRRARVGASVYDFTMKDQQLTAVGGAANFNQLVNAARTKGRGAELDLQVLATDSLMLSASASYNFTQIRDRNLRVDACGNGCTVLDPVTAPINPAIGKFAPTVSIDGNKLPQAPRWVANLSARYTVPLAGGELFVVTDWSYRSKINFFLYESTEFTGKSLTEGGLRVGYGFGGGKYEVTGFVRNLTNEVRVVGGIDFNNLTGFINEPRNYGLSFKASF